MKTGRKDLLIGMTMLLLLAVGRTGRAAEGAAPGGLPRLLDLGSKKCIPCKMMEPVLEELKKEYAGRLQVDFIDVWQPQNTQAAKKYGIRLIPTQIFFDEKGKELWRHEGYLGKAEILAKWKELGYDLSGGRPAVRIERWTPAAKDTRSPDQICYMCDGDINPKTAVVVNTDQGPVRLCSLHCYFIMYSCLTADKTGFEQRVRVTDYDTGQLVPVPGAVYLYGVEEKTGRPWVRAFASRQAAEAHRASVGGSIITWDALKRNELSHRCGFCDRACYPQDAAEVIIADGVHTYGCCSHCALGVAARTGKDITVYQPDRLTGQMITVKTHNGSIASIEPKTAVAWFGMRRKADGSWRSAGCFHQGFFATPDNLKRWLEENPYETGKMIPIAQALADKMKLSAEQIRNACKLGQCAPK